MIVSIDRRSLVKVRSVLLVLLVSAGITSRATSAVSQTMPTTGGETLSGKHLKPADAVKARTAILVAGFSHDGGMRCGAWMKAVEGDPVLKDVAVLELAMLEKAPGILRGMIKNGMRQGVSAQEQDRIVVMTQDQKQWEKFFGVGDEKDPYILLLDEKGDVLWHGHGAASDLEPQLRNALEK